jgi:hypothetical protein
MGTHNLSVSELSDTPYNISAGGTDFSDFYQAGKYSTYWNTTNSTVPNGSSALSYIPEITWGSYCASPLFASYLQATGSTTFGITYTPEAVCNSPAAGTGHGDDDLVAPVGGGGGVSIYTSLPTWQSAYGVGLAGNQTSSTWRNQPDISFFASNGWWGHALVYCQSDAGATCNFSNTADDSNALALAAGGTSFVAPQMAGMMALVVQKTGARQGVANYTLYNLGTLEYGTTTTPNTANLASCSGSGQAGTAVGANCIFHDIAGDTPNPWQGGTLTSSNVQPCKWASVQNCYQSIPGETYGLTTLGNHPATDSPAYPTSQGYDAATGLGSPNIANLVNNWNTVTPLFASTTTLSTDSPSISTNGSATLTATVTATGRGETLTAGPPAVGTVDFYIGSNVGALLGTGTLTQTCTGTAPANLVCPPSTATLVVPASSLANGANTLLAAFLGDAANDAPSTSSTLNITVQAPTGPVAGISPPSLPFGNQNTGTTSGSQMATLSNTGATTLTISGIGASTNFGATSNCGGTLASSTSCTIYVTFSPTSTGLLTGMLTVTDNGGGVQGSTQTVSLSGMGINPEAGLSATTEAFGNQVINTTSSTKTVTLTSTGTTSLSITNFAITGTNAGNFHETTTCPSTLAPAAHCTISLTYTPTILGAETASLTVADSASNSPQTVALTGTGVVPANLSATLIAFGNVGENSPSSGKTITLYNNASTAITISSVSTGIGDFTETNTCGLSLAAKGHCTITVTLTPTILGAESGTLTVTDSAPNSPQTATLTGTGVVPANLSVTSIAFGNVAENSPSSTKSATLYNNEAVALTISSITTGNPDFAQTNTCSTSLAAKGHCTITVTFTPSTLTTETGTLTVTDAASNTPQTATLSGAGIGQATASPTSLTFSSQRVGTTSGAKSVTLTNNLPTALTIGAPTFTGADPTDFSQTNTCGVSLAAKAHCTISVKFTPGATGTRTATLNVNDSANNTPQTVGLTGTGQ